MCSCRVPAEGDATILHADLDAFYASVEQRDDPRLRGRPVIVGGGVVLAASYEAKAFGVRTAMGGRAAPRAVPAGDRGRARACRRTRRRARPCSRCSSDTTPLVEGLSIDEAFLDVGGLRRVSGTPTEIAGGCAATCASASVSRSPSGSRARSSSPRWRARSPSPTGCCVVPPDRELEFLHPLPVERLWGVGPVTAEKLHDRGIATVGEVARARPRSRSSRMLGRGVGPAPPRARAQPRSRGRCRSGRRRAFDRLAARARPRAPHARRDRRVRRRARRPRSRGGCARPTGSGRTVVLRLRFDDFTRATRSHTLAATDRAHADDPRDGARAARRRRAR